MIKDIFVMAIEAMRSYKIRTFLTLIGVIIGVASVIMVTTAGGSVSSFVAGQFNVFNPTGMVIGTGTGGTRRSIVSLGGSPRSIPWKGVRERTCSTGISWTMVRKLKVR